MPGGPEMAVEARLGAYAPAARLLPAIMNSGSICQSGATTSMVANVFRKVAPSWITGRSSCRQIHSVVEVSECPTSEIYSTAAPPWRHQ